MNPFDISENDEVSFKNAYGSVAKADQNLERSNWNFKTPCRNKLVRKITKSICLSETQTADYKNAERG